VDATINRAHQHAAGARHRPAQADRKRRLCVSSRRGSQPALISEQALVDHIRQSPLQTPQCFP
jgi:hypothetical protein